MISLLRMLRTHFPPHRLPLSDFNSLPDAIPGVTAPVVQARMRESAVASSTIFVRPGFFDRHVRTRYCTAPRQWRLPSCRAIPAREQRVAAVYWRRFLLFLSAAEPSYANRTAWRARAGCRSGSASRTCSRIRSLGRRMRIWRARIYRVGKIHL